LEDYGTRLYTFYGSGEFRGIGTVRHRERMALGSVLVLLRMHYTFGNIVRAYAVEGIPMIITTAYNSTDFDRLMEISDTCYEGVERPPRETMKDMVEVCDVFLAKVNEKDFSHSFPEESPDENHIIGFVLVRTVVHPYIWSIAVDKSFQGRGVGGNLLREVIEWYTLQKAQEIKLHVHEDNPAQKLYWDYGFRVKSVEEGYYMPKDGLVMRRELPSEEYPEASYVPRA